MTTNTDTTAASGAASLPDLQTVVKYLCGEGPLCGVWFGEDHPDRRFGRFWWRRYLRAALAAPAAQEAEPAGWMNPATSDVLPAAQKADWLAHAGPYGAHKVAPYTVPLYAHPPRPQADAGAVPAVPEGWRK